MTFSITIYNMQQIIVMLSAICADCHLRLVSHISPYAECLYPECHYAECLYLECRYAEWHYTERRVAILNPSYEDKMKYFAK